MEKLDARKRYTQKVLKQSFLTLLKDKPVNKITVKEVCALAQLNRATFYAHYSDCFDLMESIEQELIDAFAKSMRYAGSLDVTALIEAIYDMVEKNQVACRVLILGNARRTLIIDRPTDRIGLPFSAVPPNLYMLSQGAFCLCFCTGGTRLFAF